MDVDALLQEVWKAGSTPTEVYWNGEPMTKQQAQELLRYLELANACRRAQQQLGG